MYKSIETFCMHLDFLSYISNVFDLTYLMGKLTSGFKKNIYTKKRKFSFRHNYLLLLLPHQPPPQHTFLSIRFLYLKRPNFRKLFITLSILCPKNHHPSLFLYINLKWSGNIQNGVI